MPRPNSRPNASRSLAKLLPTMYFLRSVWPAVKGSKPCQMALKPSLVDLKPCLGDVVPSSEVPYHGQTGGRPSPKKGRPSSWDHWLSLLHYRPSLFAKKQKSYSFSFWYGNSVWKSGTSETAYEPCRHVAYTGKFGLTTIHFCQTPS